MHPHRKLSAFVSDGAHFCQFNWMKQVISLFRWWMGADTQPSGARRARKKNWLMC